MTEHSDLAPAILAGRVGMVAGSGTPRLLLALAQR
jgi:hypothetical protein